MNTENYVRTLRDTLYRDPLAKEQNCSSDNWKACREHWMRSDQVKFLEEHVAKLEAKSKWRAR